MIETWLRTDNMYPHHATEYEELYDEGIYDLGK